MNELDKADYLLIVEQDRIVEVKKNDWPEKKDFYYQIVDDTGRPEWVLDKDKLISKKREALANGALVEWTSLPDEILINIPRKLIKPNKINFEPGVYPIDRNLWDVVEQCEFFDSMGDKTWKEVTDPEAFDRITKRGASQTRKVARITAKLDDLYSSDIFKPVDLSKWNQSQQPSVASDEDCICPNDECLLGHERCKKPTEPPVRSAEEIFRECMIKEIGENCTDAEWEELKPHEAFKATLKAMEIYANQFRNGAS